MKLRLLLGLLTASMLVAVYASSAVNSSLRPHHYGGRSTPQGVAQSGAITGRVLDTDGHPVFYAKVQAINTESGMGKVPTTYTDDQGVFLVDNLGPGRYRLLAAKEEDGYPSTDSTFYSMDLMLPEQVLVQKEQMTSDVELHLGPKVARLVGRVVDTTTNEAVEGVLMTLRRIDDTNNAYKVSPEENGEFEVLIPPVLTTIEVSAPGYEKKKLNALLLRRGEVKRFKIALLPAK